MAKNNKSQLTLYKFLQIIGIKSNELDLILYNLDLYYFQKEEFKLDENGIQRYNSEGIPLKRILWPSKGKLKQIQKKLEFKIFKKIKFPEYVQGGIKKKSGVTNAKIHLGKKFKFLTDIKMFYPSIDNLITER